MARVDEITRVQLAISSSYHPQFDGQTNVVNKSLEHYLRAYAANKPYTWVEWLPLAEFWFNTNFHTSTKLTPFEALFGYPPPKLLISIELRGNLLKEIGFISD